MCLEIKKRERQRESKELKKKAASPWTKHEDWISLVASAVQIFFLESA